MKKTIRLSESDLHMIIKESVNAILNEHKPYFYKNLESGGYLGDPRRHGDNNSWDIATPGMRADACDDDYSASGEFRPGIQKELIDTHNQRADKWYQDGNEPKTGRPIYKPKDSPEYLERQQKILMGQKRNAKISSMVSQLKRLGLTVLDKEGNQM